MSLQVLISFAPHGRQPVGRKLKLIIIGVIPRAAASLFEKLAGPKAPSNRDSMSGLRAPKRYSAQPSPLSGKQFEKNWTLKATYVEIYNEHLRDLLVPDDVPLNERSQVAIREDTKGHILLTGLHAVEINSVDDLLATLNFGSNIRQTDSTAINAKSSRSHAVFSLNLVQRKPQATSKAEKRLSVPLEAMTGSETMMTIDSKFHFVDLAGSERLKNTGAQGDRAKEGISINAGLASLGKVISQLSSRQAGSHVSYRDSKLTRMLQDSLGGSAITYMIACVTPAEYHLSETLNTVQYAQRARAIQSKPRIQQNSDESDKQALIDRLKAEVAFLRDQIRSAEKDGPATNGLSGDNQSHSNEKELELQNQLFHSQESYEALSQRHAKLLSEMTKARDSERSENRAHEEREGEFATERIRRSNNFAEAAEQVVLEYEETIRSLEHSISSTRAALSNTEAILLERESALAYTETVNTQLQVQVGKLKESVRDLEESESSLIENERRGEAQYHYLENELEGHTSNGDEKSAKIEELTRENARLTGNEVVREGYVNDIEESLRLAELNQGDLKKEVRRLAEVVERHRGIENLDKLLHDLDGVRTVDAKHARRRTSSRDITPHSRHDSYSNLRGRRDTIHEDDEHGDNSQYDGANSPPSLSPGSAARSEAEGPVDNGESIEEVAAPLANQHNREDPIEVKVVTDKLENVTKELLNLKVEHGATVTQYEDLTAKYEEALSAITELQHDSMRHDSNRDSFASVSARPLSFLADARVNELRENGGQYSSSRSLSSELSLAGESPSLTQLSDAETAIVKKSDSGDVSGEAQNEAIAAEVEELRRLGDENEKSQMELARQYAELHRKHVETMDVVEELKSQVHRAKMSESNAQRHSLPALRRKSSHGIMVIDRAHRSFASLRNIATEHFEGQPDVMQNFELNLNSAMHELHTRSERVQQLEAEIAATKKEMEMKMTIISGLTRERASIKQSPIDMSAMSAMRDQLLQSENQIRILQETHRAREEQLGAELGTLRAAMAAHSKEVQAVAERAAVEQEDLMMDQEKKISLLEAELTSKATQDGKIAILEAELKSWEERHETALASLQTSEKKHLSTIAELESRVAVIRSESAAETQLNKSVAPEEKDGSISETDIEQYRAKHEDLVASLQHEVDEHKAIVAKNAEQIAELQASHSVTISQLEEALESMMVEDATKTAQLSEEKQELEVQHKKSIARVAELEEAQAQTKSELDEAEHMKQELEAELEASRSHALTLEQQIAEFGETAKAHAQVLSELESHKTKVSKLEQQLDEQNLVIKTHEDGLALLRANHARDIEEIKTSHAIEIEDAKEKAADVKKAAMADMLDQHQLRLDAAYQGSSEVRNELANAVSHIGEAFDGEETILFNLHERIDELVLVHIELEDEKKKAAAREQELETVRTELRELEDVSAGLAELLAQTSAGAKLKDKRATLTEQLSAVKEEMVDLAEKNNKNSNLVEQLEDQLTQIYDVHKEETKRLSTLQGQRSSEIDMANQARNKVESELEAVREKYTGLQVSTNWRLSNFFS